MITAKKRAKIIVALKRYPNCAAVARQIGGVSHETVRVIANQSGIAPWRKFSAEEREKIAEALRQNPNGVAVAKSHGNISDGTVRRIAKEKRIKLSEKGKRLAPKQRALILKKLKANPNARVVAREVGKIASERTVQIIARKAQIPLTARGRNGGRPYTMTTAKLRLAQAVMADRDIKVDDLCKELGVTRQTLYRFVGPNGELRRYGAKLLKSKAQRSRRRLDRDDAKVA
jgi:transposase-like protein